MWDAMNCGNGFVTLHPDTEITFVGHSKGGGEAIATADYTNKNAITFNAAKFKFSKYVSGKGIGTIDNYYVEGEVLSSNLGVSDIGTTHWLNTQYWKTVSYKHYKSRIPDPIKNHSMDAVIKALD